jgi:hypothetical protein
VGLADLNRDRAGRVAGLASITVTIGCRVSELKSAAHAEAIARSDSTPRSPWLGRSPTSGHRLLLTAAADIKQVTGEAAKVHG